MLNNEPARSTGALLHESGWTIGRRVIGALLLRELLTRYGRNNIGFLWLFVEPMLFVLIITAVWSATRSIHGSVIPIVAFALTGYSSMLLWRGMPGRCIGALRSNMPLLYPTSLNTSLRAAARQDEFSACRDRRSAARRSSECRPGARRSAAAEGAARPARRRHPR